MSAWHPGIKAFCAHWAHAPMLQQTLETLEREFADDNDACIDAAKAIVECACRLLIQELDDPASPIANWPDSLVRGDNPSFKNWVSAAFRLLAIVESKDDSFSKVVSQHYKLTEELGAFRNLAGTISHGREGLSKKLSAHHRRSALLAADALITFLHEAYLEREPDPLRTFEPYERFPIGNRVIDESVRIDATVEEGVLLVSIMLPNDDQIPLTIEPSRLLFGVDREAYKYAVTVCRETATLVDEEAA